MQCWHKVADSCFGCWFRDRLKFTRAKWWRGERVRDGVLEPKWTCRKNGASVEVFKGMWLRSNGCSMTYEFMWRTSKKGGVSSQLGLRKASFVENEGTDLSLVFHHFRDRKTEVLQVLDGLNLPSQLLGNSEISENQKRVLILERLTDGPKQSCGCYGNGSEAFNGCVNLWAMLKKVVDLSWRAMIIVGRMITFALTIAIKDREYEEIRRG